MIEKYTLACRDGRSSFGTLMLTAHASLESLDMVQARVAEGSAFRGAERPNISAKFTSEDIMMTNLHCVRPCYANNASGIGDAARAEVWHDEVSLH